MRSTILPSIAVALTFATAASAVTVPTPRASPLPATAQSRPLLAAQNAQQSVDLATRGYVEEEHLVRSVANAYEWAPPGSPAAISVRVANRPYVTRILVRRPVSVQRFSGNVIVEILAMEEGHETAPIWGLSFEKFLRDGDAHVAVTLQPAAAEALRGFDPVRYEQLALPAVAAAAGVSAGACQASPGAPGDLAFDILAQVGALLRSSSKENPLSSLDVRRVFASGYATGGGQLVTYANALHAAQRLGNGRPVFDGYLQAAGGALATTLGACGAALAPDDPRLRVAPRDAPFVSVQTQSDFAAATPFRRPDGDERDDAFRLYEIAGAAQRGPFPAGRPPAADLDTLGVARLSANDLCAERPTELFAGPAFNAIWTQLIRWSETGTAPPRAEPMSASPDGRVAVDERGNAIGGVRSPLLDAPLAAYTGSSISLSPDPAHQQFCRLSGSMRMLDAALARALYKDKAEHMRRFSTSVGELVTAGWLLEADAPAVRAAGAALAFPR